MLLGLQNQNKCVLIYSKNIFLSYRISCQVNTFINENVISQSFDLQKSYTISIKCVLSIEQFAVRTLKKDIRLRPSVHLSSFYFLFYIKAKFSFKGFTYNLSTTQ